MSDQSNFFQMKNILKMNLGILTLIIIMLSMTILPLPTFMLDLLFSFNISLSLVILIVTVYVIRPLEFSIFPTILLVTTLLRLTLNIASTRVILLHGHNGPGAAGDVIKAFGEVVIGGNFVVGMIIFSILMIINFVVVTKGAGRVSEVSARFILDALPGKQMSIDADLNAGVITQEEAKKRRSEITQEADFYGSMDGASKFVRGDAVAGLLILMINLIGGAIIGVFQEHMTFLSAFQTFSLLTIGDGLVAQIPSLLMSISAAIMVTRVNGDVDVGQQTISQLFTHPKPVLLSGIILLVLSLIPKMPHLPFIFLSCLMFLFSYFIKISKEKVSQNVMTTPESLKQLSSTASANQGDLDWDEVVSADRLTLEIGYGLINLVGNNKDGILVSRIKAVRRKVSQALGFLVPTIHIRDNINMNPNNYRILLKNVVLAEAEVQPDMMLSINPGHIQQSLAGIHCKDPTFGLSATWIGLAQKEHAQSLGYTTVDASTVIATHINQIIKTKAAHLLGYDEVQQLLNKLGSATPKLVETLTNGAQAVPLGIIVSVMQRLLQAEIPLIDLRTISEKMIESWSRNKDIDQMVDSVRAALRHLILYSLSPNEKEVAVAVLEPDLAQILHKSIQQSQQLGERVMMIEPSLSERIYGKLLEFVKYCDNEAKPAILLVSHELRGMLEKIYKPSIPVLHFLSHQEIPDDRQLNIVAKIG